MKRLFPIILACTVHTASAQESIPDSTAVNHLNEVVVEGEAPRIKGSGGALTVDLRSIVRDKPVSNVLEALGYLPGVAWRDGTFELAGAGTATVIINGEVQNMPVQALWQLLYSIPTERLKNVEIMYSAPAKYHVQGAVINVVLTTPGPLDGLQGQVTARYDQRHYDSWKGGVSAVYSAGQWTFYANYLLTKSRSWSAEDFDSRHTVGGVTTDIAERNHKKGTALSNLIHASATRTTTAAGKFSLTYNGQINSRQKALNITDGTPGLFENNSTYTTSPIYNNITASWHSPFGLELKIDWTDYRETRHQSLYSHPAGAVTVNATNAQHINRWHFTADQTHNAAGWEINYGAEYRLARDRSDQRYTAPDETGFSADIDEHTADIYAGTARSFDWGLSFSASVAGEYYRYGDEHSWNVIPQLGATFYKTPTSIFQLNFTSQRVYPSYWETHGGTGHIDSYSMVLGNPDLKPWMNYATQLNYIFKQKYAATIYWLYRDKYSVQLPYQQPDRLALVYQTVNLDYDRIAGIQLYAPVAIGHWLNSTATANLSLTRSKASHFHDISFDRHKSTAYLSLSNTIRPARNFPVSLTLDASYNSPSLQGLADMSAVWRIDACAKWTFGRGGCAELNIKANDVFNTWSPTMVIKTAGQDYRMTVHDMSRSLSVTFTWRFHGFKPKASSIDTERFGTGR